MEPAVCTEWKGTCLVGYDDGGDDDDIVDRDGHY